jgi:hypothetical protein
VALVFALSGAPPTRAAETVSIGGSKAALLKPATQLILMPGGDRRIAARPGGKIGCLAGNSLVRNRAAFATKRLAALVVDTDVNLAQAVMLCSWPRSTAGHGDRHQPRHLTCGPMDCARRAARRLGADVRLSHHRNDGCRLTQPAGIAPFIKWVAGKACMVWLSGGSTQGNSCKGASHNGFLGLDAQMVALAAAFR